MTSTYQALPTQKSLFGMQLRSLHLATFVIIFITWTVLLLIPVPKESASKVLKSQSEQFYFGKTLHVAAYAFLTIFGGLISLSNQQRWMLLITLALHGALTEYLQGFVNRGSSLRDVGLDLAGVVIGLAITWRFWKVLFDQPQPTTPTNETR